MRKAAIPWMLVLSLCAVAGDLRAQGVKQLPRVRPLPAAARTEARVITGQALVELKPGDLKDTDIVERDGKRMTGAQVKALAKKNLEAAIRESQARLSGQLAPKVPQAKRTAGAATRMPSAAGRERPGLQTRPQPRPLSCEGAPIYSVTPVTLNPGDPVVIRGCGFKAEGGQVALTTGPAHVVTDPDGAQITVPEETWTLFLTSWSDTTIHAMLPAISGLGGPKTVSAIVKTVAGVASAPCEGVTITPFTDEMTLTGRGHGGADVTANPAVLGFRNAELHNNWRVASVSFACEYLVPYKAAACIPVFADCYSHNRNNWPTCGGNYRSGPNPGDTRLGNVLVDWKSCGYDDLVSFVVDVVIRGPRGTDPELPPELQDPGWWPF
ncbi:MAG: hypothetical protein HZC42_08205 [Candidatus Eisenbacteria bacterium]|nr:hypothetical protein [Candidatus Eisenbacteria bacterium]